MKFVLFSDLHVEDYPAYNSVPFERLNNTLTILDLVFAKSAILNNAPIIFTGDLVDKAGALKAQVMNRLYETFAKNFKNYPDTKFIAISGNHDMTTRASETKKAISILDTFRDAFPNFILLDEKYSYYQIITKEEKIYIQGIPFYDKRELFLLHLNSISTACGYHNILLTHQNDITQPHADIFPLDVVNFDMVFNGHIHNFNKIASNFYTLGNPLHRDLNDEGKEKFIHIYDSILKKIDSIETKMPKFTSAILKSEEKTLDHNLIFKNKSPQEILKEYCENEGLNDEIYEEGLKLIQ